MNLPRVGLVWAEAANGIIGKAGVLPWHLPEDLAHFKAVTLGGTVVMGRKTWESLPERFRPLPGRMNIVLSRNPAFHKPEGVLHATAFTDAMSKLAHEDKIERIFVIGGQQIFKEAIVHPLCERIYLTKILQSFNCDAFLPPIPAAFQEDNRAEIFEENNIRYYFAEYSKKS